MEMVGIKDMGKVPIKPECICMLLDPKRTLKALAEEDVHEVADGG